MPNKVKSFAVGTSMDNNRFSAIALKLKLENGEWLLTRWDKGMTEKLLKALGEYMLYLHTKKIDMGSDAAIEIITSDAPQLAQAEVDDESPSISVDGIKGRVETDQVLTLFIQLQQEGAPKEIRISPDYVMPLNDHVGSILDRFDPTGNLRPADETLH